MRDNPLGQLDHQVDVGVLHNRRPLEFSGSESAKIVDLAIAAAKRGLGRRLRLAGMSRPDIIEYLPADHFVPKGSWPDLVSEWNGDRMQGFQLSFKQWLRKQKGAVVDVENLHEAAASMDQIPREVTDLMTELLASGHRQVV
jgi:hypothetical protein